MFRHADALCRIREGKWPPIMTIGHVLYSIGGRSNLVPSTKAPHITLWRSYWLNGVGEWGQMGGGGRGGGEPWMAVDAHHWGVEAQNRAQEVLWSQIRITLIMSRIRVRIKVKSWIRIWKKVMRICNRRQWPGFSSSKNVESRGSYPQRLNPYLFLKMCRSMKFLHLHALLGFRSRLFPCFPPVSIQNSAGVMVSDRH